MNDLLQGIIVPILTPFHEDESLNIDELCRQIERMIQAGIHGIFCLGTNGENYALSADEKRVIIRETVRCVHKRVPVYAGTGCITTKETISLSNYALDVGADVLSIITPSFAAISQDQLFNHYKTVAEKVPGPILVYNIPARTGVNVSPVTLNKLAAIPNIIGAKDSSGNFDNMLQYIEQTRDMDFSVLSGNDSLILWNLLAGGKGGIAGCANIYPGTMASIYNNFMNDNLASARTAQDSIRSLRNCFKYGNPNTVIKLAVKLLGYDVGECRAPFNGLSEDGLVALRSVLEENKKLGMK